MDNKIIQFPNKDRLNGMLIEKSSEIAKILADKGAIIVSSDGNGGVSIGTYGLTPPEVRDALCLAIYYSHLIEQESF